MLELVHVAKEFDLRPILDDVSISLTPGTRYVLTAKNGSGKTTLLMIMAGLSRPTRGLVLYRGKPLNVQTRKHLGVVLQMPFLYGDLTGRENLLFFASLFGQRRAQRQVDTWLEEVRLDAFADNLVKTYSKGMKQRLSLVRALLHEPAVLLLDEPYDGLDAASRKTFSSILERMQTQGTAIFMVTHDSAQEPTQTVQYTLEFGRLVVRS